MRLVPEVVTPDVIRALERVKAKTRDRWTVSFVLSCIEKGFAGLYAIRELESHIAWMVVERMDQGEVWMNVWILESQDGTHLDRAEDIFPLIDDLARSIGAASWRCTGRKGWAKWLKPVATVYERKCT